MATWGLARRLFAVDVLTMAFVTAVGAGTLAVLPRVPAWPEVVAACALIAAGIPFAAWLRTHLDLAAVRFVHDWALAIVLVFIYRSVVLVAGPAHSGRTIDAWLISADRWLFGTDPTVWLQRVRVPRAHRGPADRVRVLLRHPHRGGRRTLRTPEPTRCSGSGCSSAGSGSSCPTRATWPCRPSARASRCTTSRRSIANCRACG